MVTLKWDKNEGECAASARADKGDAPADPAGVNRLTNHFLVSSPHSHLYNDRVFLLLLRNRFHK